MVILEKRDVTMDISSFIPSTDNLFKFLFVGGLLCIVFAIVYPLEKQQRIELEVNVYNKQVELVNKEISALYSDTKKLVEDYNVKKKSLINLYKSKAKESEINLLEDQIDSLLSENSDKQLKLNTTSIVLKYEKERIKLLQGHISSFSWYRLALIVAGTFFTLMGLILWYKSSKVNAQLQECELKLKKHAVDSLLTSSSRQTHHPPSNR